MKNSNDRKFNQSTLQTHMVILLESGTDEHIILDYIDDEMRPFLGSRLENFIGQQVRSIFGKLGNILESIALDIVRGKSTSLNYPVEFTDPSGQRRIMWIEGWRLKNYAPQSSTESDTGDHHFSAAIAFHFKEQKQQLISKSYQSAVFHGIIGDSASMKVMFRRLEDYGPTDAPVVITGETGTGKELVARALHRLSSRKDNMFVAVNCTALNEELFESELFGHERGAFTGASKFHMGRFERADGGSLFLDEIGDMPQRSQAKLLRVLEDNSFERVGGEQEIKVDVRIVAATNISLEHAVGRKTFRSDLYHRLAVLRIHVPPLRERTDDIKLLVQYFLDALNSRYGKNIKQISPDALRLLTEYHWPGNVRELRNVLERVYVETHGKIIGRNAFREWERERDYLATSEWNLRHYETQQLSRTPIIPPIVKSGQPLTSNENQGESQQKYPISLLRKHFPRALPSGLESSPEWIEGEFHVADSSKSRRKIINKQALKLAFQKTNGNITQASRLLDIHKATFYRYMKKFGLHRNNMAE